MSSDGCNEGWDAFEVMARGLERINRTGCEANHICPMFFPAGRNGLLASGLVPPADRAAALGRDTGNGPANAAMALRERRNGMAFGADRDHGTGFPSGTARYALCPEPAGGGRGASGPSGGAAGFLRLELQPSKLKFRNTTHHCRMFIPPRSAASGAGPVRGRAAVLPRARCNPASSASRP